jgi:hypothetical protein
MAYTINNTAGATLVTLADGTIDTVTTDIALFGKGYAGFGERLNENLVKMLENFANTSAPANKQKGQLWYDTLNNQIKGMERIQIQTSGIIHELRNITL